MDNTEPTARAREKFSAEKGGNGDVNSRLLWATNRFRMETENRKTRRYGVRRRQHWFLLRVLLWCLKWILKTTRQYDLGVRNAYDISLREMDLAFANLPAAFEGFTILHLSDLHLDGMPDITDRALDIVRQQEVDLCVLTGDYRHQAHGPHHRALRSLEKLLGGIRTRTGFIAVLGNHDDCQMVKSLEDIGICVLINEGTILHRGPDQIRIIGTDDVHYFYTDQAINALEDAGDEFSIVLVHSSELYSEAAELGADLYLCGHTHGGQVCLPGGIPIFRHLYRGRRFYRGHWRYKGMQGVTNRGLGTSGLPVRFNCRGEMLLLRLHRTMGNLS